MGYRVRPDVAEDLAQEIMARAFKKLDKFHGDAAFLTWVYRIAINHMNKYYSSRCRYKESISMPLIDGVKHNVASISDPQPSPEATFRYYELDALVSRAIDGMPPKYGHAVSLNLMELTNEEAAASLGINVNTLKFRLYRGRQELRRRVAQLYPEMQIDPDAQTRVH